MKFLYLFFASIVIYNWPFFFKVIVFERGDLVFVFNFHPENTYEG